MSGSAPDAAPRSGGRGVQTANERPLDSGSVVRLRFARLTARPAVQADRVERLCVSLLSLACPHQYVAVITTGFETSERFQKGQQRRALIGRERKESSSGGRRFAAVKSDGIFNGCRRAVVQQRPAQPEAPQRRRPELLRRGGFLTDAVSGPDIVQQQI